MRGFLRVELTAILLAAVLWSPSAAAPDTAVAWTPPLGIPAPEFGISVRPPAAPSPWTSAVPGFYYVQPSVSGASDSANPYGTPARPRATIPLRLPPGSVVELHGTYDRDHTSPNGIQAEGTAAQPVFIRGASAEDRPNIVREIEVSGSYVVLENLRFRARDQNTTGSLVLLSPAHHMVLRHSEVSGNLKGGGMGIESWYGLSTISDVVIWDNKIHDNGDVNANFDQDRHGIHVGSRAHHIWVVDNEMWRNSGDGIQINARTALLQSGTHHIYVGRNISHHNKQDGFWTKQAVDVIFSQNVTYANRPSNSSMGVGLGFQYAPSYVWFLFNEVYDSDYGIGTGSDSGLGTGSDSFYIGNLIHDIHDSIKHFQPASGWQNCGISLPGGINRYVVNNTIYNVDSGICSPGVSGKVEMHNNLVFGIRRDGFHIMLEFAGLAREAKATGNVFGPDYRGMIAGAPHFFNKPGIRAYGGNSVVRDPGLVLSPPGRFDLLPTSPAIDAGVDDPAGVYRRFQERYGIDIRRDILGRPRPSGKGYDAGAFERSEEAAGR